MVELPDGLLGLFEGVADGVALPCGSEGLEVGLLV